MTFKRKLTPKTTTAPMNLVAVSGVSSVALSWTLAMPPFDFTRFDIYRDGTLLDDATGTSFIDDTGADGTTYAYTVKTVRTNPHSSQEFSSVASNSVNGGWTSTTSGSITIVDVVNSTSGPTISVNLVTDADTYRFERSSDPLGTFTQLADQAGTTYQDTAGTAGTLYFYRVRSVEDGTASDPSSVRAGAKLATGADTITLGTLSLYPTYRSIGIMLAYTGDADLSATAHAEFSDDGGTTWRHGLPVDQWSDGTNRFFAGSLLKLTAGTDYTVRLTVADTGGGGGIVEGTVSTRTESITARASLTPTHYVASTGSDSNNGTASGTPWLTLEKAVTEANSASAAMVIQVAAGYYERPDTVLVGNGKAITITGATSPIKAPASITNGTDNAPLDTSVSHVVLYEYYTAPNGSSDTGSLGNNVWTEETFGDYTVWKTDVGVTNIKHLAFSEVSGTAYSTAKAAEPERVASWKKAGLTLATATGFAELVHTNLSYTAGCYQDGATTTLYLRLPGDVDPNDCYIWLGRNTATAGAAGIELNGPDLRVSGLVLRGMPAGIRLTPLASGAVVDHCWLSTNEYSIHGEKSNLAPYAENITIESCRFTDSNLWRTDGTRGIPWRFIKQNMILSDGSEYSNNQVGDRSQSNGIKLHQGCRQVTIRNCTFDGPFNGVGSQKGNTDIQAQRDVEIYDCLFEHWGDDALEPEGTAVNWRCWDIWMQEGRSGISTDCDYGPLYLVDGRSWRLSTVGVTDDGHPTSPSTAGEGHLFKMGAPGSPSVRVFLINWTHWNDKGTSKVWSDAVTGAASERWYLRNVIARDVQYVLDINSAIGWDDDYNLFAAEDISKAMKYDGTLYNSATTTGANSLAAWRTAVSGGTNTNKLGSTDITFLATSTIDVLLTAATTGDLSLSGTAVGVALPNVADGGGTISRGWEG